MILMALRITLMSALVALYVIAAADLLFDGPWCHPDLLGCVFLPTYDDVYDTVIATLPI